MRAARSRTAEPIGEGPHGRAMGSWGMWQTVVVLGMFVAGIAAAALYLETGEGAWPPEELPRPGATRAAAAWLTSVAAAAGASLAWRRIVTVGRESATGILAVVVLLLTLVLALLIADLRAMPFRWDVHAFASVAWTFTGLVLTLMGTAWLMTGAVLVQLLTGVVDEQRHLELSTTGLFLWFTVVASAALLALVHLLPVVGGGA